MDNKKIGELLLHLRGDKTQKEVAESVGVSQSAIRQYEHGNRSPSDVVKYRLSKLFEMPVQDLFFQDIFFDQH